MFTLSVALEVNMAVGQNHRFATIRPGALPQATVMDGLRPNERVYKTIASGIGPASLAGDVVAFSYHAVPAEPTRVVRPGAVGSERTELKSRKLFLRWLARRHFALPKKDPRELARAVNQVLS
jgi:hypothetical protein